MHGKGGRVCARDYRNGNGCPLIVRSTSEDVLTGNVFGILRHLRPSLWLRPMLNAAFNTRRFQTCSMSRLRVVFWPDLPPPAHPTLREGWSQPDLLIAFDRTLVVVECKYNAPLATRTTHDRDRDQLVRLLDVAHAQCVDKQMFAREPWVLLLALPALEPPLVTRYRDPVQLEGALRHHRDPAERRRVARYMSARLGYLSWRGLASTLASRVQRARRVECLLMGDVIDYVHMKVSSPEIAADDGRQGLLPVIGGDLAVAESGLPE
jgi:hypothetical protein